MTSPSSNQPVLLCLEHQQLSAVVFVQDYLQLQFDGPCLTTYVWPKITAAGKEHEWPMPGYRDALCAQIAKVVASAIEEPQQKLLIQFADGASIAISLLEEDRDGPEAAMLQGEGGKRWNVW